MSHHPGGMGHPKLLGVPSEPECSFCGQTEDQAERLVQGRGVAICEMCVSLAFEFLQADGVEMQSVGRLHLLPGGHAGRDSQ